MFHQKFKGALFLLTCLMLIHRTEIRRTFLVRETKIVRKHSSGALFQISGFMDRENPRLSDLQIGFIKGLVMIRVKSFHNFPYPDLTVCSADSVLVLRMHPRMVRRSDLRLTLRTLALLLL